MRNSKHVTLLRFALATTIAALPLTPAVAQTRGLTRPGPTQPQSPEQTRHDGRLSVPISGIVSETDAAGVAPQELNGTFTIQRFIRQGSEVVAVGTLVASFSEEEPGTGAGTPGTGAPGATVPDATASATAAPATGAAAATRTIVSRVALPLVQSDAAGDVLAAQVACQNLRLQLGPLDLGLLGLAVEIDRVQLDVSAVQASGTELGNLLCAVSGLLDGDQADRLVAVLNDLLQLLG
jgi:hypothetical protein